MKVVVTHLKAPWPTGARLGDVVEVGQGLPGCFAGKCSPAHDAAEAAHTYVPSEREPTVAELRAKLDVVLAENAALKALLEAGGGAEAVVTGGGGSGPIKPSRAR